MKSEKGESGSLSLAQLLYHAKIEIVEMNEQQIQLVLEAWRKFGKVHHPAKLNLGDCCSYALAKYSGEPLLFKGNDFSQTDIKTVELE